MYMRKTHAQYVEKWSLNMKQIDILGKEYSMIYIDVPKGVLGGQTPPPWDLKFREPIP